MYKLLILWGEEEKGSAQNVLGPVELFILILLLYIWLNQSTEGLRNLPRVKQWSCQNLNLGLLEASISLIIGR